MESRILQYLKSRWYGTQDWIFFHENPETDLARLKTEMKVDFGKPWIGMLTNVFWDAQLHYPANAFSNMLEWVTQTIQHLSSRHDLQLIIRIHPAEIRGFIKSRQLLVDEIRKAFPVLPDNVAVIPPEHPISTYAVMEQCNAALIFGTKMGVELTSMGIPVIVAGEAWIRNKGITSDARSQVDYLRMLDELPFKERLPDSVSQRAQKYAFHFFFRRMIPLEFLERRKRYPPYQLRLSNLDLLREQQSIGLDIICDGILRGTDFIYPAEREFVSPSLTSPLSQGRSGSS
jgi:hypothetical protein